MSIRQIRHFAPVRGTSESLTFVNRYAVSLSEPVPSGTIAAPVTQIRVTTVPNTIPLGYELEFVESAGNCTVQRMITSAIANPGDRTISVVPYIGSRIPCEWFALCGYQDLSGRVYRAQVKKKLSDSAPYLTFNCSTVPTSGTVIVTCTTTGTEDTNADFRELPVDESELQLIDEKNKKTGELIRPHFKKLIKDAWTWDLEYSYQGGPPIADTVGLFWLQPEATV